MLDYLVNSAQSAFTALTGRTAPDHTISLTKDLRVSRLFLHPIKSCRGVPVTEAAYDDSGLRYDRTWLIIDAQTRKFCTARELARMVLIQPNIDAERNVLRIEIPSEGDAILSVETPLNPSEEQLAVYEIITDITIWGHKVDGYAVSTQADEALSSFFGKQVRLVRKGPSPRPSGPDIPVGPTEYQDRTVRYQDFYPILVASAASLAHVQHTLAAALYPDMYPSAPQPPAELPGWPVKRDERDVESFSAKVPKGVDRDFWSPERSLQLEIERFRPNILVESAGASVLQPWEEDGWTSLELLPELSSSSASSSTSSDGSESDTDAADYPPYGPSAIGRGRGIYCLARCGRCMVPCIDPSTGVRDNYLPYRVLQGYRQVEPDLRRIGKPCFGVLSAPREKSGIVRVGDVVRVTGTTDPASRHATGK